MKTCVICGKPIQSETGRRKYCSEECAYEAEKRREKVSSGKPARNPDMKWTTYCVDCGKLIRHPIKCIRCEDCQRAINAERSRAQARNGAVRPLGSIDKCKRCGKEYVVNSGTQRYCKECAQTAMHENIRKHKAAYMTKQRADAEKYAEIKRRNRVVPKTVECAYCGKAFVCPTNAIYCTPEQRAERNRKEREWYAKRKNKKGAT